MRGRAVERVAGERPEEIAAGDERRTHRGAAGLRRKGSLMASFDSLRVPEFRALWIGLLIGMAGMQMMMIARTILVDELTGSAFLTGLVTMGFAPTMLLTALFGGVAGDRMERRTVIQATQAASAVLSGAIRLQRARRLAEARLHQRVKHDRGSPAGAYRSELDVIDARDAGMADGDEFEGRELPFDRRREACRGFPGRVGDHVQLDESQV